MASVMACFRKPLFLKHITGHDWCKGENQKNACFWHSVVVNYITMKVFLPDCCWGEPMRTRLQALLVCLPAPAVVILAQDNPSSAFDMDTSGGAKSISLRSAEKCPRGIPTLSPPTQSAHPRPGRWTPGRGWACSHYSMLCARRNE